MHSLSSLSRLMLGTGGRVSTGGFQPPVDPPVDPAQTGLFLDNIKIADLSGNYTQDIMLLGTPRSLETRGGDGTENYVISGTIQANPVGSNHLGVVNISMASATDVIMIQDIGMADGAEQYTFNIDSGICDFSDISFYIKAGLEINLSGTGVARGVFGFYEGNDLVMPLSYPTRDYSLDIDTTNGYNIFGTIGGAEPYVISGAITGNTNLQFHVAYEGSSINIASTNTSSFTGILVINKGKVKLLRQDFGAPNAVISVYAASSILDLSALQYWPTNTITNSGTIIPPQSNAIAVKVAPSLSGTATVGSTITVTQGVYYGRRTNMAVGTTRAIYLDGVFSRNFTGNTFVVDFYDQGKSLTVRETVTNSDNTTGVTFTSNAIAIPALSAGLYLNGTMITPSTSPNYGSPIALASGDNYLRVAGAVSSYSLNGVISGAGKLIVDHGAGKKISLTVANTLTGGVEVKSGTLKLSLNTAIPNTCPVTVRQNAILMLGNATGGGVTMGALTIDGGTLRTAEDSAVGHNNWTVSAPITFTANGGILMLGTVDSYQKNLTLTGAMSSPAGANIIVTRRSTQYLAIFTLNGNTANMQGNITVDATVGGAAATIPFQIVLGANAITNGWGSGTFTLKGNATFSTAAMINQALAKFSGQGTGTITITTATTVGSWASTNPINLSGVIVFGLDNLPATISGVIAGSGSLNKRGTAVQTVTGNNTYTGPTTIFDGTLRAGHVKAFGTGEIRVQPGGTLDKAGFDLANTIVNNGGTVIQ